jgi:selenide,water dikinase
VLDKIVPGQSESLMEGFETNDDAAVYRLDDKTAALLTVDFFTPIVDDPYDFGRITAANALSDIYAMGGRPLTAMNLLAFPCSLGPEVVGEVVRGGAEKVREAGAVVVGGHTIEDREPKYGLSILGVVDADRVVYSRGARPGDALYLTKPIGTGVIGTALKNGLEDEDSAREVIESMAALNASAAEAMGQVAVHAATDVSGFGLVGHIHEMASASGVAVRMSAASVPLFDRVVPYAEQGVVPGRTADVVAWADEFTSWEALEDRDLWMRVLCDPQTSGGLLIAVASEDADLLRVELEVRGVIAARVGECVAGEPGAIVIA